MAFNRSPILLKALVGSCALVGASVASLSGLFLMRGHAAFQQQLELRAQSMAAALAGQSQFALLLANKAELERLASTTLAGNGDLCYVVVEDAGGKHLAAARRLPAKQHALPPGPPGGREPATRRVTVAPGGTECVEAAFPVVPHAEGGLYSVGPEYLGRVRVAMSMESVAALFRNTLRYVLFIGLLILVTACVLYYIQIRRLLKPMLALAGAARQVGRGDSANLRSVGESNDEVGILVRSFKEMVGQVESRTRELNFQVQEKEQANARLAEAQQRLMELSRRSGMAEVATGVLHNVGNVLNSVNVSATLAADRIRELRLDMLSAAVTLLKEHEGNLHEFLTRDSKGVRLLPYLGKLAGQLEADRQASLEELNLLRDHVAHIKQIVATQQNYAKVSGVMEQTRLATVAEDALRMLAPAFERHGIQFEREFENLEDASADKHQILQILLNLLRNAKESVKQKPAGPKRIKLSIRRWESGRVRIAVQDTGIGLDREQLTGVFAHGFTTKRDGHGFGLHSGALAANQMRGALWAESAGPGKGATFILELPWETEAERSVA